MKPEENPGDPTFWESMGITPIVIDDSTPESFEAGMDQLMQIIEAEVTRIQLYNQVEDE